MKPLTKIKVGIAVLVFALLGTFVALNTQTVELNLIVAKLNMSRSLLIIAVFLAGALVGWIGRSFGSLRSHLKLQENESDKRSQAQTTPSSNS
tara:strand:+ start:6063 stop:6341 length:279 start_codon:yes stop_codon:yes gene_type:complete